MHYKTLHWFITHWVGVLCGCHSIEFIRARAGIDWPHPGQTPLPSPRIKFWKSPVGITITPETYVCDANFDNKYKEQFTITVIFAFEGFMQYLYLSSLRLLFSISRAKSPVSKVVWVNLAFKARNNLCYGLSRGNFSSPSSIFRGATNENRVQNHLNIALLNVF